MDVGLEGERGGADGFDGAGMVAGGEDGLGGGADPTRESMSDGGGAVVSSNTSTVDTVPPGDSGAPSGPMKRTDFPLDCELLRSSGTEGSFGVDSFDASALSIASSCLALSSSSESATPGVAIVDHAPD